MDAPATNSSHPPGLLTIAFFGLGAMGSSMLICLSELAERVDVLLRFVVVVLNDDLGREALFDAERLVERINFVEPADFAPLFDGSAPKLERLADVQVLVNAAQPGFNQPLLGLGLSLDADVVDLASDMDDTETERSLTFSQYTFDQA